MWKGGSSPLFVFRRFADQLLEKIQPGKFLRERSAFGVPMMRHAARDVAELLFCSIDDEATSAMNADVVLFDFLQGGYFFSPLLSCPIVISNDPNFHDRSADPVNLLRRSTSAIRRGKRNLRREIMERDSGGRGNVTGMGRVPRGRVG